MLEARFRAVGRMVGKCSMPEPARHSGARAVECFGAAAVIAIDSDPHAIAVAKSNARTECESRGVQIQNRRRSANIARSEKFDVITANLFSELLIACDLRLATGITEPDRRYDSLRHPAKPGAGGLRAWDIRSSRCRKFANAGNGSRFWARCRKSRLRKQPALATFPKS